MARSSLFRIVRRLARRAHAANHLGLSSAELPPAPPVRREGPSRRSVLLGSLGAAALLPLAQACGDNLGRGGPSIAIIGGGIAGLTAAHFLDQAGVRAQVYEASMRAGGRIFTARGQLAGGQLVELGGELIDSDHVVLPTLLELYGFTLDDLQEDTAGLAQDVFFFGGAAVPEATLVAEFGPVAAKMELAVAAGDASGAEFERIDAMSIPEWLELEAGLPATSLIRRVLEVAYVEEYGHEVAEQSAWNLITLIDHAAPDPFRIFGESDERYHTHQGNDALPAAIAHRLADRVYFDHELTRVARSGDAFALTFAHAGGGDDVVLADHIVYALPFTKLREVDLEGAGLSDEKRTIIDELGYGNSAKLMMQFAERHWERAQQASGGCITDVGELQTTWATSRGQDGPQGILTNFVGGARGSSIGEGTAEAQAQLVLPWIDTVFPGTAARYLPGSAIRQHWPSAPFARGSYTCYKKGQWAFFGKEGAREGNQHFCGEHCSESFQGYMEGGAETGALVAAELLDDLGLDHPPLLAALLDMITAAPRASYHRGFGRRMKISQIRRRPGR
ncbi:MAG TPA: NAD(P)/FAD-dependent oxidoreductase [Kofleriaceae bacterium]|nr:NAD(P)/FAD-dependent oxidoreductase [Kofleriaceae bacterium]